jgi:hypothetical protein
VPCFTSVFCFMGSPFGSPQKDATLHLGKQQVR